MSLVRRGGGVCHLSRRTATVALGGSTRPRLGSPALGWAPSGPGGSGGRAGFLSHIGRVWTGDPVLRAFPVGPETPAGVSDGRRAQGVGTAADVTADRRS